MYLQDINTINYNVSILENYCYQEIALDYANLPAGQ